MAAKNGRSFGASATSFDALRQALLLTAESIGVEVDDLLDLMRYLMSEAFSGLAPITRYRAWRCPDSRTNAAR